MVARAPDRLEHRAMRRRAVDQRLPLPCTSGPSSARSTCARWRARRSVPPRSDHGQEAAAPRPRAARADDARLALRRGRRRRAIERREQRTGGGHQAHRDEDVSEPRTTGGGPDPIRTRASPACRSSPCGRRRPSRGVDGLARHLRESTKPLSDTVPRNVSTLIAVDFTPGSLMSALLTRAVTAASSMTSPVDWRVCVGAQPAVASTAAASAAVRTEFRFVIDVNVSCGDSVGPFGAARGSPPVAPRYASRQLPTISWLSTALTPSIPRATCVARSTCAWSGTLPLSVTLPRWCRRHLHAVDALLGHKRGLDLGGDAGVVLDLAGGAVGAGRRDPRGRRCEGIDGVAVGGGALETGPRSSFRSQPARPASAAAAATAAKMRSFMGAPFDR